MSFFKQKVNKKEYSRLHSNDTSPHAADLGPKIGNTKQKNNPNNFLKPDFIGYRNTESSCSMFSSLPLSHKELIFNFPSQCRSNFSRATAAF